MTTTPKVMVLIAHRNPLLSAGLEAAFRVHAEFEVIVGDTLPVARGVDVIVADFDNGVKLALAQAGRVLPVMIVSEEDGEAPIRQALAAGIRGYLLLGSPIESIVDGARIIVRGGLIVDPFAASKMLNSLNDEQITKRELAVLRLLVRGLSDKEMASRLGCATGTIKCHVKRLRKKLKASSRTEAIFIAHRRGLLPREMSWRLGEPASFVREPFTRRQSDSLRSLLAQSVRCRAQ